jgi:hypothetical protein
VTNLCGNCLMPFDPVDLCWCEWCDDCCDKAGGTDRHDEDGLRSYPIFDRSFGRYMEQTPYNGRISPDPKAYPQARQEINTTRGERMKAAWEEAEAGLGAFQRCEWENQILHPSSILREAAEVVKQRSSQYDERERNFTRIADIWSVIFGHTVWPEQVAMCMIGLKLAREVYKPSRDNLTDIAGYADCLADLRGYYDPVTASPTEAPASAEGEGTAVSPPSATRSAPSPDKGPMGWV